MSIFWIGGPEGVIVPSSNINTTEEDRYFLPGIVHGTEDRLMQVYGWNSGNTPEDERIGAKYLDAASIVEWSKEATRADGTFDSDLFEERINDAEEFVIENDGTGDFVTLNAEWSKSVAWSYEEVISWAQRVLDKEHIQDAHDKEIVAATKTLINAMVEYGLAVNWCDSDIINALVDCGITQTDFEKAGFGEFVNDYFAEDSPEVAALRGEISNLHHELKGISGYDYEEELAPEIEKRLFIRECQLCGALVGVNLAYESIEAFMSTADFEKQLDSVDSLEELLIKNGFLPGEPSVSDIDQPFVMKAINIDWDVDFDEDRSALPTEIEIPVGMVDEEEISDYLSDVTGFCHKGFTLVMSEDYSKISTEELSKMEEAAYAEYYKLATKPSTNPSKEDLEPLEAATAKWEAISDELNTRKQSLAEKIHAASVRATSGQRASTPGITTDLDRGK